MPLTYEHTSVEEMGLEIETIYRDFFSKSTLNASTMSKSDFMAFCAIALHDLRCRYMRSRGGKRLEGEEISEIIREAAPRLLPCPLFQDELDHIDSEPLEHV